MYKLIVLLNLYRKYKLYNVSSALYPKGGMMNTNLWTLIFFYGSLGITIVVFIILVDKKRLKELIPIGLFIGVENYTVETIGLYYGYWKYPLENPGYPEVIIISSIIFFPIIAMLFYQYLSSSWIKNSILIACFLTFNMIIEVISIKTTNLFVYGKGTNLLVAFLMYLGAYILIILFAHFYNNLDNRRRS